VRKKPYTAKGIKRVPCFRCKKPSRYQWQVCADDGQFRGLCELCDIDLNKMVLRFMNDPEWERKMAKYRERVFKETP